jgi:MarR family transcriptional regulator for hemolysin
MVMVVSSFPQEDDLLLLISDTARMIGTYADRLARRHGMTKAQWVVMIRLDRNPGLSQKDLADMMEVEPITVGRLVDRLERRGFVAREPDEQDRRIWRLRLLPAATPLLKIMAGHKADIAAMLGFGIPDAVAAPMRVGLMQAKANVTAALKNADGPGDRDDSKQAASV